MGRVVDESGRVRRLRRVVVVVGVGVSGGGGGGRGEDVVFGEVEEVVDGKAIWS